METLTNCFREFLYVPLSQPAVRADVVSRGPPNTFQPALKVSDLFWRTSTASYRVGNAEILIPENSTRALFGRGGRCRIIFKRSKEREFGLADVVAKDELSPTAA